MVTALARFRGTSGLMPLGNSSSYAILKNRGRVKVEGYVRVRLKKKCLPIYRSVVVSHCVSVEVSAFDLCFIVCISVSVYK